MKKMGSKISICKNKLLIIALLSNFYLGKNKLK